MAAIFFAGILIGLIGALGFWFIIIASHSIPKEELIFKLDTYKKDNLALSKEIEEAKNRMSGYIVDKLNLKNRVAVLKNEIEQKDKEIAQLKIDNIPVAKLS